MTPLEEIIHKTIAAQGAISMAAYMELALQHPDYGYYRKCEPIGRTGDFVTAPEVSQLFGEMIGIWCVEKWRTLDCPKSFALIEFGPGRGTMMADLLRATAHVVGFRAALKLYLIESNEVLKDHQRSRLAEYAPTYIEDIAEAQALPIVAVANEFFDALPVRQFEKTFRGWAERMATSENGSFVLTLRPLSEIERNLIPKNLHEALPGVVYEFSPKSLSAMRGIARTLIERSGAFLIIDYGYAAASGAPTIQAVSQHKRANVFERPGEIDLTAHVDFAALGKAARAEGAFVSAVMGQGEFLKNCGIDIRADALKQHATEDQVADITLALNRLTDNSQMGTLFKVLEVRS